MALPQMSGPHAPTALGCPYGGGCPGLKALCLTDNLAQQASAKQVRSRIMFYGQKCGERCLCLNEAWRCDYAARLFGKSLKALPKLTRSRAHLSE